MSTKQIIGGREVRPLTPAERTAAMQNPLYGDHLMGDAFRAWLVACIAVSDYSATESYYSGTGIRRAGEGHDPSPGLHRGQLTLTPRDMEVAQQKVELEREITDLKEGLKATESLARAEELHKSLLLKTEQAAQGQKPEPFTSKAEMMAAMRDERYSKDSVYRAGVEARIDVTPVLPG